MNRLIVLLFKIILGKIKYWPNFTPNLNQSHPDFTLVSPEVLFHPNSSFSLTPNSLKSQSHLNSSLTLTPTPPFMLKYTLQVVSFQSIFELVSDSSLTPRSRSTWIKVKAIMDGRIGQNVIHGVGRGPNSDFFTLKMVRTKWLNR